MLAKALMRPFSTSGNSSADLLDSRERWATAATQATGIVIINQISRFDPPDFAAGKHKAEFIDEFGTPLFERTDLFAPQTLPVVPMDAREPLFVGHF